MEPSGDSVKLSVGAHRQRAMHRFKKKDDQRASAIGGKRILQVMTPSHDTSSNDISSNDTPSHDTSIYPLQRHPVVTLPFITLS